MFHHAGVRQRPPICSTSQYLPSSPVVLLLVAQKFHPPTTTSNLANAVCPGPTPSSLTVTLPLANQPPISVRHFPVLALQNLHSTYKHLFHPFSFARRGEGWRKVGRGGVAKGGEGWEGVAKGGEGWQKVGRGGERWGGVVKGGKGCEGVGRGFYL